MLRKTIKLCDYHLTVMCSAAAPFLTYEFVVRAVTSMGRGNFSVPRSFETKESGRY